MAWAAKQSDGKAAAGASDAEGSGYRVVMPFACSVVRKKKASRLTVVPSEPRYYDIISEPRRQSVELCAPDRGERAVKGTRQSLTCFKTEVVAFELACDGGTARWVDVAAAGAAYFGGGVRLNNGILRLQFRGRLQPWTAAPCLKGDWPHRGEPLATGYDRFPDVGCEAVGVFEPTSTSLLLPAEHAPLAELGARVFERPVALAATGAPALPGRRRDATRLAGMATLLPGSASSLGAATQVTSLTSRAGLGVVANAVMTRDAATPSAATPWMTLVEIRSYVPGQAQDRFEQVMVAVLLGLALLAGVLSGLGWLMSARQRRPFRPADAYEVILRRDGVDLDRPDAQLCGELCKSAQGLITQVHDIIDTLEGVAPLRRTLLREIRDMEYYLASVVAATPADDAQWHRMRNKLQRIVNDIMRLRDITESAQQSLVAAPVERGLPKDKNEAFEALGANPTTSVKILKRLVDALRTTWHPDLAADEHDRLAREERIKQINVAWDLISDKRVEA
ncbi:MAG: J domain-containing protein [Pseudomonadota bacterium]